MSSPPTNPFDSAAGSVIAELALAASTSSHCHVIVQITSHLNQRWARSSLTTNGSTVDISLSVIAFADRPDGIATASVIASVSDIDGVLETVRAADIAALGASPAKDAQPFANPPVDGDFDAPAVLLSPAILTLPTTHLGDLISWGKTSGIELFGYLERESTTTWLAMSNGARRRFCAPADRLEITAKSHSRTRSTWHGYPQVDLSDDDWGRLRSNISQALTWQATSIPVLPGRHSALLSPSAIGDFVIDLYWSAGSRDAAEGRSAFHDEQATSGTRIGQVVAGSGVFVSSDPLDQVMPAAPFAVTSASGRTASVFDNGLALARTDWIHDGRLDALIATSADAARLGIPPAPVIDTIRLDLTGEGTGAVSVSDLAARLGDGLMLTCVWYNRTVDPQTMLLTGLTRDGVYVVRGGEVVGASPNFRFNDSPLSMLSRIRAATDTARTLPREMADYANNVAMPAVVVDGMNFTSISDAR